MERVRVSGPPKVKRNAYYPAPGKVKVSNELGNSSLYLHIIPRGLWTRIIIDGTPKLPQLSHVRASDSSSLFHVTDLTAAMYFLKIKSYTAMIQEYSKPRGAATD